MVTTISTWREAGRVQKLPSPFRFEARAFSGNEEVSIFFNKKAQITLSIGDLGLLN